MNHPTLLLAAILLSANFAIADEPTTLPSPISGKLGQPVQLFNGKDLDGWTFTTRKPTTAPTTGLLQMEDVWFVKDGILHDKGNPFGYIRTTASFTNYFLTVEQRHLDKGNGGIFFALTGPDAIWPHCLEAQGMVGEEGDIRGIANFKLTADPAHTEAKRIRKIGPSSEKPIGQWETLKIIVDHNKYWLYVNDILQNQATNDGDLSGSIALQAEGGLMEFRKVELTPIEKRDTEK